MQNKTKNLRETRLWSCHQIATGTMSLWSISAAKRQDEVPGSSKWIRKELHTLHDLMAKDVEQFAFSVTSELMWIDEQMEEIIRDNGENPRLLLESPMKLRGSDSPVKQIQKHVLGLKSPEKDRSLKEIDLNILRLSPVKLQKLQSPQKSPAKSDSVRLVSQIKINEKQNAESAESKSNDENDSELNSFSTVKVTEKFPTTANELDDCLDTKIKATEPLMEVTLAEDSPTKLLEPQEIVEVQPLDLKENLSHPKDDFTDIGLHHEEISFQAIKTAIRKSIANKTKSSDEANDDNVNSFKSATEEAPTLNSLLTNHASVDTSREIPNVSVETVILPLKDDEYQGVDSNLKSRKSTHTPARHSLRESQGFALLPHRGPLTVKPSNKRESKRTIRRSLFDGLTYPSDVKVQGLSSNVTQSLYPRISLVDKKYEPPSTGTLTLSPNSTSKIPSPKRTEIVPSVAPIVTPRESPVGSLRSKIPAPERLKLAPAQLESPERIQGSPRKHHSPLAGLFASVGSTLRKAKSKFIKETQSILDSSEKVHKPDRKSSLTPRNKVSQVGIEDSKSLSPSPQKKLISQKQLESLNSMVIHKHNGLVLPPTKRLTPELPDPPVSKAPQLESPTGENSSFDEDDDKRDGLTFSPVSSIYGPLRKQMGGKSPIKTDTKPKSLARVSLSKPLDETDAKRTSRSGLTAMFLETKSNKIPRPKSFASEQLNSFKRKTQTEEEYFNQAKSQAYRKIGTKIVPPSVNPLKQPGQDAKRRRTGEKLQSALQKRASRAPTGNLVGASQMEEKSKIVHAISSQTLMKTAVLQHARLNDKQANPFQSSSGTVFNLQKSPVTPTAPTVLPEIFSESEDDDEGCVLKDWANSPQLRNILIKQQYVDPDKVFGPIAPLQMEEIFKSSTARVAKLKNRGSSAQWTGSDALSLQEVENYKKKFKK